MNEPLVELLARCKDGDEQSISELVKRFRGWALDLAENLVSDLSLAEDVVQEAFVSALARLDQLHEPQAFPGWFRQIVRTHANRILRKRREVSTDPHSFPEATSTEGSTEAKLREVREVVRAALQQLAPPIRDTAQLFYLEERTCGEIANHLLIPEGTVKRRLHDARKRLRNLLLGSFEAE